MIGVNQGGLCSKRVQEDLSELAQSLLVDLLHSLRTDAWVPSFVWLLPSWL